MTELKDALPLVTILILAHTDKKGIDLFGSIAQFANCDVLYMLNRQWSAPAEWSRWNVSLRLAVALAWPAEPVGVAQPATRRIRVRIPLVPVACIRLRRGA